MTHLGPLSPENWPIIPRCPVRDLGSPKQERAAPWTSQSSPRGLSGSNPSVWGMGVLRRKSKTKSGSLLWAQVPSRGLAHNGVEGHIACSPAHWKACHRLVQPKGTRGKFRPYLSSC